MRAKPTTAGRCRLACAALLLAMAWSGLRAPAAEAQEQDQESGGLDRARTEIGELRYEDALGTLAKALEAGTSGPAATAQIYLLLGEVRASMGQRDEAAKAFELALSIDPEVELRKGLSPKISRPFRKARRALRGAKRLALSHRILRQDPPTIAVLVQADSQRLVVGARVTYWTETGGARAVTASGNDRIDLALPAGVQRIAIAGVDEHGNRVVELGTEDGPLSLDIDSGGRRPAAAAAGTRGDRAAGRGPGERAATARPRATAGGAGARPVAAAPVQSLEAEEQPRPPLYASWVLWGSVALGLGAAGTFAGVTAQSAVDELDNIRDSEFEHEYSEAKQVADRAEQRSLIANICFAAAGASAIASALFYIHDRRSRPDDESAAIAPLVGPDQVGVAASLRF